MNDTPINTWPRLVATLQQVYADHRTDYRYQWAITGLHWYLVDRRAPNRIEDAVLAMTAEELRGLLAELADLPDVGSARAVADELLRRYPEVPA